MQSSQAVEKINCWQSKLPSLIDSLRQMAGGTEKQFLDLGSKLQDFAMRSARIHSTACELTALLSGSDSFRMSERLLALFSDIEGYLEQIKNLGSEHFSILDQILKQLDLVVEPLQSFQKMDKALKMLSISTKIESSRLGELGSGFITLAMDVEKLSGTVNEKSAGIMAQRLKLSQLINTNTDMVRKTEEGQYADAGRILSDIKSRLDVLQNMNSACSTVGSEAQDVAEEVSANIATVVSSMQFHDITRQQTEHVIEALEKLLSDTSSFDSSDSGISSLAQEAGDICEMQTAQLRHAGSQLYNATQAILDSLRDIASKQATITYKLQQTLLGSSGSSENSQLDLVQNDMRRVTAILNACSDADMKLTAAMHEVAVTIGEICNFVTDIESVGTEIDLIALNAQIKAAHTGPQGAALGVLAEAIKRLSLDAVAQTESVSKTLQRINLLTRDLETPTTESAVTEELDVKSMDSECKEIIQALGKTSREVLSQLSSIARTAESLANDISSATSSVSAHETANTISGDAISTLDSIIREAREIQPASSSFRDNLKNMEKKYTMESERMIHEMMAARHGVSTHRDKTAGEGQTSCGSDLGDNVDLF